MNYVSKDGRRYDNVRFIQETLSFKLKQFTSTIQTVRGKLLCTEFEVDEKL